ncbi:MAG: hypothetical protein MUE99_08605 [Chitinophagaceae bacterium]|nr:hypothetical protein [Chitinophagaceae bacterium]
MCKWFLMLWGSLFIKELQAQHCPFDGLYTIALRVKTAGKKSPAPVFYLLEKETDRKDTCRFTNRVDSIPFNTEKEVRAALKADPTSTRSRYLPRSLKTDFNFLKGNQVVFLNMSAKDCMVVRGNDYDYIPREFIIRYNYGGKEWEVAVAAESVFGMCSTKGSWKRIKPVDIVLMD